MTAMTVPIPFVKMGSVVMWPTARLAMTAIPALLRTSAQEDTVPQAREFQILLAVSLTHLIVVLRDSVKRLGLVQSVTGQVIAERIIMSALIPSNVSREFVLIPIIMFLAMTGGDAPRGTNASKETASLVLQSLVLPI